MNILDQCRNISAGTMGTLTHRYLYSELDIIQAAWLAWLEKFQLLAYQDWQEAWTNWVVLDPTVGVKYLAFGIDLAPTVVQVSSEVGSEVGSEVAEGKIACICLSGAAKGDKLSLSQSYLHPLVQEN